jgi:hypothetical protein
VRRANATPSRPPVSARLDHGASPAPNIVVIMTGDQATGEADLERAFAKEPRIYSSEERGRVWNLDYDQYRRLGLRRSGCIELEPQERRCLSKARCNRARRGTRTKEYARRTQRRRAEAAEIKRGALAEVYASLTDAERSQLKLAASPSN